MITAKTNDGFEVELDEDFLDDAEMLEALVNAKDNVTATFILRDNMLDAENKKRLYDHLRNKKGKVSFRALDDAVSELVSSFKAGKNSASSPN